MPRERLALIYDALQAARSIDPMLEESITNLPGIVKNRNFLAHARHAVINGKIWNTAENCLPLPIRELRALLDEDPLEEGDSL